MARQGLQGGHQPDIRETCRYSEKNSAVAGGKLLALSRMKTDGLGAKTLRREQQPFPLIDKAHLLPVPGAQPCLLE